MKILENIGILILIGYYFYVVKCIVKKIFVDKVYKNQESKAKKIAYILLGLALIFIGLGLIYYWIGIVIE